MSLILHIETATKICSVALSENGILLNELTEVGDGFIHGERLTILIQKVIGKAGKKITSLSAISISNGPGSYTGLRIGLSTAKGIAFALNCPIINLNTLEIMVSTVQNEQKVFAMLDARRMEVYACGINEMKEEIFATAPIILDSSSLSEFDPFLCIGDGALKVKEIWKHRNIEFREDFQVSSAMQVEMAYKRFCNKEFANPASLTPNYLKEFQFTSK
ncbi:MAG: tRNA (adenosine(37)-N6)-threonylcarbamoyltransferase complex dimerization subunit type 1 TsaB [Bacteroidetes bacterium]|nr:tRNA (adenosine(37)-N6)-threonylcarbamoyltransferase complex dimerization subunit type 1 TsaB [Bacteroidota bacterium]